MAKGRLIRNNGIVYQKEANQDTFWALYGPIKNTDAFEIAYNDSVLDRIGEVIGRAGNFHRAI